MAISPYDAIKGMFNKDTLPKMQQEEIEKRIVGTVEEKYGTSRNFKTEISQEWKRYHNLYVGNHYTKKQADWKAKTIENICFSIVESMIPLMTDRQPEILIQAQEEGDVGKAQQVNTVVQYVWNRDNMQEKLVKIIRDQLVFGTGVLKISFNPEKLNGLGDIETFVVDCFDVFPDPNATEPDELEYLIFRTRVPVRKLKQQYPDKKDLIITDSRYLDDDSRNSDENDRRHGIEGVATVFEYWHYDEDGKTRVTTVSNGVLLEDKESPFEKDGFPFIFFYDHKINGRFWGIGEYKQLEPLQKELNKVRAVIMDNMIANQNTIWVVDKQAGIKKHALTNEHGKVIEKNAAGNLVRVPPPQLPHWIQNQLELTKKSMEEVSGIHDVSKGIASGSVTAASAIQILTENSQTRIRAKLRNTEHSIKRYGEWVVALIRQFYDSTRIVRITGKEDEFTQFSNRDLRQPSMNPEHLDPMTGQPLTDESGNYVYELLTEFDIKVSAGSSMLLNKNAKYQQVFEMFMNNSVDVETLLNAAEIGDTNEIVGRMIKYGQLKDPQAPQVSPAEMLQGLGLRFNLSTQDPNLVYEALQKFMSQYQEVTGGATPPEQLPPELKRAADAGMLPQNPSQMAQIPPQQPNTFE